MRDGGSREGASGQLLLKVYTTGGERVQYGCTPDRACRGPGALRVAGFPTSTPRKSTLVGELELHILHKMRPSHFRFPGLPGAGPSAVIADVKIIPLSIKIIFFAVRVYTAMIATLGRMIKFSLTPPQAPPGPRGLSCVATRSVSVRTFREAQLVP